MKIGIKVRPFVQKNMVDAAEPQSLSVQMESSLKNSCDTHEVISSKSTDYAKENPSLGKNGFRIMENGKKCEEDSVEITEQNSLDSTLEKNVIRTKYPESDLKSNNCQRSDEKEDKLNSEQAIDAECQSTTNGNAESLVTENVKEEKGVTSILQTLSIKDTESEKKIDFVPYKSEEQLPDLVALITIDLSEPYSIYTYRYFLHNWPHLSHLVSQRKTV